MITLTLDKDQLHNMRQLVVAGAKSPQSGGDGIIVAAQLLLLMAEAEKISNVPITGTSQG